jgi:hypothetical protein
MSRCARGQVRAAAAFLGGWLNLNSEAETADDADKQAWRRNRPDEFEARAVNKTYLSSVQSAQSAVLFSVFEVNPNSEVEFLRWRSAAVPAAATWDGPAVGKYSVVS